MHNLSNLQLAALYAGWISIETDGHHSNEQTKKEMEDLMAIIEGEAKERKLSIKDLEALDPYDEENGWEPH